MAKMTIHVDALNLDKVKNVFQVIKDVSEDQRVPDAIRKEIKDRIKVILEADDTKC